MNNLSDTLITADINAANLFSIAGMLREFASDNHADIMSNQVHHQALNQGISPDVGYDALEAQTMQFTAPVLVIADIAAIMLDVRDGKAQSKGIAGIERTTEDGMESAIKHLMAAWSPFILEATRVVEEDAQNRANEFDKTNRFRTGEAGPESMN